MRGSCARLEVYLLSRVLAGVGTALAGVSAVIVLVVLVDLTRTLGGQGDLTFFQLAELTALKAPAIILILLPFVFLFGSMGAFVTLNRRSELVAMRATGLSAWRLVAPAALAAFILGLVTLGALNPAAAFLGARFDERRAVIAGGGRAGRGHDIWLRQGDDRSQIVIHARGGDIVGDRVRLKDVSLFVQSVGPGGELDFSRRIEAAEAVLFPGYWRLRNVKESLAGAQRVRSEQLLIPSTLDRRTAVERFASPGAIGFWKLPRTIRAANLAGYSAVGYQLRLQQLLATPLLLSAMSVLAAAFSLRLMRLGDLGGQIAIGVGLGFVMFFLNEVCGALGASGVLPAFAAAWGPPALALLAGVTRLCYTEDG